MKIKLVIFTILLSAGVTAQKGVTRFGIQFKPMVPVNYFKAGPVSLSDSIGNIEVKQKYGYSMGMVIRHNFTDLISFETGINYVKRNYDIIATSKIGTLDDQLDFEFVNYEIPLQALIYVRLSEKLYMNVSSGVALNSYVSHVTSQGDNFMLSQLSFRGRLIGLSYLANVGFEYRTKEKGSFYLGASLVTPLTPITDTEIKYEYTSSAFSQFQTFLNGNYLTIDFRFYFPEGKEKNPN